MQLDLASHIEISKSSTIRLSSEGLYQIFDHLLETEGIQTPHRKDVCRILNIGERELSNGSSSISFARIEWKHICRLRKSIGTDAIILALKDIENKLDNTQIETAHSVLKDLLSEIEAKNVYASDGKGGGNFGHWKDFP